MQPSIMQPSIMQPTLETYDCEPTLTDSQVLEFCKRGYLKLEAVVPEEINARTREFRQTHTGMESHELLEEA